MSTNRQISIDKLYRYPVKSMQGEELSATQISPNGIEGDRLFMVTDESGRFITQRELPKLSLFNASWTKDRLKITYRPDNEPFVIDMHSFETASIEVSIWKRKHLALSMKNPVNQWLSDHLHHKVQLVKTSVEEGYNRKIIQDTSVLSINFPDGYPILILGTESLNDLNNKLSEPVGWDRFRPNIVIGTAYPFQEDDMETLNSEKLSMKMVKPCPRCQIVATDQEKGILGKEPLATLSKFRRMGNNVYFGMYAYTKDQGVIKTGERLAHM